MKMNKTVKENPPNYSYITCGHFYYLQPVVTFNFFKLDLQLASDFETEWRKAYDSKRPVNCLATIDHLEEFRLIFHLPFLSGTGDDKQCKENATLSQED